MRRESKIVVCLDCKKEKPHGGRGLCQACYKRNKRWLQLWKFAPRAKLRGFDVD